MSIPRDTGPVRRSEVAGTVRVVDNWTMEQLNSTATRRDDRDMFNDICQAVQHVKFAFAKQTTQRGYLYKQELIVTELGGPCRHALLLLLKETPDSDIHPSHTEVARSY